MESLSPMIDAVDCASSQFIGILFNWGLYGILISQTCTYATTYSYDLRINKGIVFVVFSLETFQTAILTYDVYNSFVLHFGDVIFLERLGHMWLAIPTLCGLVGWIAQLFYAWRIYKISRSRRISGLVIIFAFAQLIFAIGEAVRTYPAQSLLDIRARDDLLSVLPGVLWTVTMVTCDLVIATVMTYYLLKLRREFYYDSSFFIRRLLALTVETGSVTALAAIMAGILFAGKPDSQAFNIPAFIIGKLYSNSLVRVLNSRRRTECTAEIFTLPVSFESSTVSQEARSKDEGGSESSVRWRGRDGPFV